jgi:PAP2 superfamily
MKRVNVSARTRSFGVCMLMATLLFAPAIAKADAVLDWNLIAVNTSIANGQNPFAQARNAAIVQLAVFEAVNAITGDYRPYLGNIVAPHGASADAAVIEAAYRVLSTYFPTSASTLLAARANSLALIPDGQAKSDGIATGDAAALAMIALRANDGSAPAQFKTPGPAVPGEYQATPSCPMMNGIAVGTLFQWQNVTPFGIPSVGEFLLGPPPALDSNQYAKTYNEVKAVGSASANSTERPPDRADVVLYYAASSPTQVFNQAAREVAQERWRSLSENAQAFALINMALSDGAVTTFFNKYRYNFWRPETAIHAGDTDGNRKTDADPSWVPFIPAPCFPSYPSAHGTLSGAGAEVMKRLYGETGHAITLSNPAVPTIVLHYGSFKQITDDISDARVYGGIHFRTDQDAGARLGRTVGTVVYEINLRAVHHDGLDDDRDDK